MLDYKQLELCSDIYTDSKDLYPGLHACKAMILPPLSHLPKLLCNTKDLNFPSCLPSRKCILARVDMHDTQIVSSFLLYILLDQLLYPLPKLHILYFLIDVLHMPFSEYSPDNYTTWNHCHPTVIYKILLYLMQNSKIPFTKVYFLCQP